MGAPDAMKDTPLTPKEVAYWSEFSCWTALVLWPLLYWVNGPAVSTDQFVVRTALVVVSLAGAFTLRTTKILRRRKRDRRDTVH